MIIKRADEKQPNIELLVNLQNRPDATDGQKQAIDKEIRILRAGIKGETESAYLIDFDFKTSKNTAVIHDLRIEINGRVAQIDHLLIHRTLTVFVLETKHFHSGMKITDEGEFMRWNDFKKCYEGMPSPLAQNERHIEVLKDAFSAIDMPTRLGTLPARLRDAIDRGEPLIDLMAKSFGVTPSVIKSMTHCPLSLLVGSWQGSVKQLAISLHSITPEFRPSTPASWARMGKAVEVIEKGTGQNITRPQNQLWLAASARRGFDMKAVEPGDVAALTQGLADMSNALHEVLAMRIGGAQSWHAGWSQRNEPVMESIRRVVSRAMSHVEFSKLLDLVRRWQDAFRRAQTIQDQDSELIRGLTWRSPVDEYANDSRIIVPLLSQPDLIEEGRAMNHCVGGYTCDCRLGKLQIWSIRTLEGQRCSTLATEFKRSPDGRWKATINQHRGHSNATPDKATIRAAHELLGNLSANDADLQQFWEWRRTLAQLSVKERGILIATRTLERSLQDALPRKLSLDILESDIRQSLQTVSASTRQTLSDDRTCRPRSMPLTA